MIEGERETQREESRRRYGRRRAKNNRRARDEGGGGGGINFGLVPKDRPDDDNNPVILI